MRHSCLPLLALSCVMSLAACGSSSSAPAGHGGHGGTTTAPPDAGTGGMAASDGGPDATGLPEGGDAMAEASASDAEGGAPPADTLDDNRDRLLGTYLDFLKSTSAPPQSNGLSGSNVSTVCDLWSKLDPSSQAVFLTLTARMQGSRLGSDGSSMLGHVTRVYRVVGGQGATASSAGSCGGGEYNRMIMSMDAALHVAQNAAFTHQGAVQGNGKRDIADIPAASYWRDSHDLGGPHAPFDRSDETNQGAPRGQTQYFSDPTSTLASSPLGRMDLTALVDPHALEMDQDYDCFHNSNPSCSYVLYGPACAPLANALGTDIYTQSYGTFEPGWKPSGCP